MPLIAIALVVLAIDLLTKYIVQSQMELYQSIPIIDNIFHITYILNPGAAFGLLANQTAFFILVTLVVAAGIIISYRRLRREGKLVVYSLGLLLGGAVGNMIDRLRYGKVVDFLDFRVWPVFNLADTAIVIGVALLVLKIIKSDQKQGKGGA